MANQTEIHNENAGKIVAMNDFQFGDIIENGWASDSNPTKRGVFLYYKTRTGRLNPGKHAILRSDGGSLGEFRIDRDAKLTKIGTIFDADRSELSRKEQDLKLCHEALRGLLDFYIEKTPENIFDRLLDMPAARLANVTLATAYAKASANSGDEVTER